MECYLTGASGTEWSMPQVLAWELEHGMGSPCDAFEVRFVYTPSMEEMLFEAFRFRAVHEGQTVFVGVVDEYEASAGVQGMTVTVRGRGLAALLLDNEAEAADYYNVSTDFILENHVYPWGISRVQLGPEIRSGYFTVASGTSQWKVLEDFFWVCGGVRPRFTKEGLLLLDGSGGDRLRIDGNTAIGEQMYTDTRCGVISQVLVKNRAAGLESLAENEGFIARGGACRRVVNVPRTVSYDAMRHTGQYQIQRSQLGSRVCRITLPELFAAFPGDRVELADSPLGLRGNFTVSQSRCWADGESAGTVLELEWEES